MTSCVNSKHTCSWWCIFRAQNSPLQLDFRFHLSNSVESVLPNGFLSLTSSFFDISLSEISSCQTFSRHRPSNRHVCSADSHLIRFSPRDPCGWIFIVFLGWFWTETVEAADRETITRALHSLFLADSFIMKSNHFWFLLGTSARPFYDDLCTLHKDVGRQKK